MKIFKKKENADKKKKENEKRRKEMKSVLDWMSIEELEQDYAVLNERGTRYIVKGIRIFPKNIWIMEYSDKYALIDRIAQSFNRMNFSWYWKFVYSTPNLDVHDSVLFEKIRHEEDESIRKLGQMFLDSNRYFTETHSEVSFYFVVVETEKYIDKAFDELYRNMMSSGLHVEQMKYNDYKNMLNYDFNGNTTINEYYAPVCLDVIENI